MPEVVITAADIEDAMLNTTGLNTNWGGTYVYYSNNNTYRPVYRFATSALPEGTITSAVLSLYSSAVTGGKTLEAYAIKDANTWVEGNKSGATAGTGECCAAYCKYNTQAWAGSDGCLTSGVDYDADASPPQIVIPASGAWVTLALKPEWVEDWKSGARVNNGIILDDITGGGYGYFLNSELGGAEDPYLTINYEEAALDGDAGSSIRPSLVRPIRTSLRRALRAGR